MLVRIIAGLASLALGVAIILGKNLGWQKPFPLEWQYVFAATGAFVFVALWLPSYVDRNSPQEGPSVHPGARGAARQRNGPPAEHWRPDEWVN